MCIRDRTETQQRYATIELECLAILVAVRKCDFYLRGLPSFEVITDHRPLLGVFKNDIFKLDNARLMRIREKLIPYNFTISWIEGKKMLSQMLSVDIQCSQQKKKKIYIQCLQFHFM